MQPLLNVPSVVLHLVSEGLKLGNGLLTLGDVVLYSQGVPVEPFAPWLQHTLQRPYMIYQELRLRNRF